MMNLKNPDDQVTNFVSIASIVAMLGTLGYLLFSMWKPGQTTADIDKDALKQQNTIRFKTKLAEKQLDTDTAAIDSVTWSDSPENIGTEALRRVTAFAQQRRVKLIAFRPQRQDVADDLDTLPYLVTVEGPFNAVLDFERDIDTAKNRLGVSLVQISSADPNTDKVSANIGLVAYLQPKPAVTTTTTTTTTTTPAVPSKSTHSLTPNSKEKTSRA